jgi:hypothetical protein
MQGCQIFLDKNYQNGENIPKDHKMTIPNGHTIYQFTKVHKMTKIYQMAI